jgi:hypothetical protein
LINRRIQRQLEAATRTGWRTVHLLREPASLAAPHSSRQKLEARTTKPQSLCGEICGLRRRGAWDANPGTPFFDVRRAVYRRRVQPPTQKLALVCLSEVEEKTVSINFGPSRSGSLHPTRSSHFGETPRSRNSQRTRSLGSQRRNRVPALFFEPFAAGPLLATSFENDRKFSELTYI